jgi:hypothetical protein
MSISRRRSEHELDRRRQQSGDGLRGLRRRATRRGRIADREADERVGERIEVD